ncbi:MAG TPA: hypothetical protein PLK33_05535 [bacterium]|jgi:hypothetical protein|nr:hypothetical protein [Dictyoglomota bacterium]HHV81375.1 hypothetical protein [bacterium]HON73128.1 hypothetical protein [bacterium]HOP56168.1 hypothetical protein [bacterium]HPC77456.1 hypothetical protein [bacterium]
MPKNLDHIKAAKVLLGWSTYPLHSLIDSSSQVKGLGHGFTGHNIDIIKAAETFLGEKGRLEATLHILQDIGLVEESDWKPIWESQRRKR